jgi:hypothetical protein
MAARAEYNAEAPPSLPTLPWSSSGGSRARQLLMWASAARPKTLTAAVVPWLVVRGCLRIAVQIRFNPKRKRKMQTPVTPPFPTP